MPEKPRPLTDDERDKTISALRGQVSFAQARIAELEDIECDAIDLWVCLEHMNGRLTISPPLDVWSIVRNMARELERKITARRERALREKGDGDA